MKLLYTLWFPEVDFKGTRSHDLGSSIRFSILKYQCFEVDFWERGLRVCKLGAPKLKISQKVHLNEKKNQKWKLLFKKKIKKL